MEIYWYAFLIVFIIIVIPVALYLIFKPLYRNKQTLNGVENYDAFMRKYVFRVEMTEEEFYGRLKTKNINDTLEYCLNDDCSVVTFTRYGSKYPYKILTEEADESIILRIQQIPIITDRSNVPYLINEFFIKKFDAKPMEYSKYPF